MIVHVTAKHLRGSAAGASVGKILREKELEAPACQLGMLREWVGRSDEETRKTHPDNEEMKCMNERLE